MQLQDNLDASDGSMEEGHHQEEPDWQAVLRELCPIIGVDRVISADSPWGRVPFGSRLPGESPTDRTDMVLPNPDVFVDHGNCSPKEHSPEAQVRDTGRPVVSATSKISIERADGSVELMRDATLVGPDDRILSVNGKPADLLVRKIEIRNWVSGRFVNELVTTICSLPPAVRHRLEHYRMRIIAGRRLSDIRPDLKGVRPRGWPAGTSWDNVEADSKGHFVFIAQTKLPYGKTTYVDSNRIPGVLRHELGHSMDDALKGFSKSPEFIRAFNDDLRIIPAAMKSKLDYYIQPYNPGAGREELMADGFALLEGGAANSCNNANLRQYFPHTLEVIQHKLDSLPADGSADSTKTPTGTGLSAQDIQNVHNQLSAQRDNGGGFGIQGWQR